MNSRRKLRVAVVNPLGLPGKEIRSFLRERDFPIDRIDLLDSGGGSEGALTDEGGEVACVLALADDSFEGADLVFLCEADERARRLGETAARSGAAVIDISKAGVPALSSPSRVAGLNDDDLPSATVRLVTVPSATSILLARLLAPLRALGTLSRLTLHVVEPASLEGDSGVEEMLAQAVALLAFKPLPKNTFGRQMVFNVFAAADPGENELRREIREILGIEIPIALTVLRGPTFHGHAFSLLFEYSPDDAPGLDRVVAAIEADPALHLDFGELVPGTVEASGTDVIHVAGLRVEPAVPGGFWVWMVVDHLRCGTALNAVRLAETMVAIDAPPPSAPRLRRGRT